VTLNWTPRTRTGGAWAPFVDVAQADGTDCIVQIWNSDFTQVARIIAVTGSTTTYTSAQQVTDFGANQQTIYFTVGQLGSIGIGTQAQGTAVGGGSSDDDPLSPIAPYQSVSSGSPAPVVSGVLPANFAERSPMATTAPWVNGTRMISPRQLADGVFWAIHFTPTSGTTARFVGAENGGGPVARDYIIYVAATNEVRGVSPRPLSTVQARLAIGRAADPRYYEVRVETGTEYVLGIANSYPGVSSSMYMDLFIE
jgi:hypothetical protein